MSPTFGQVIRAARLGYHWAPRLQAMVRMSDCGPHTEIRLCPADQLPKGASRGENPEHRCWWECKEDLLGLIAPIRGIRAVKSPIRFLVDDNGNLVGGGHV